MPPFGPVSRRELVRSLRLLGFEGPFSGGKHQFMVRVDVTVRVPNPHGLLSRLLKQAGVDRSEWERL